MATAAGVVRNLLGTKDKSREKMFPYHIINNTYTFSLYITNENTSSSIIPILGH